VRFIARDFTAKEQADLQQSKGGEPVIQNHTANLRPGIGYHNRFPKAHCKLVLKVTPPRRMNRE